LSDKTDCHHFYRLSNRTVAVLRANGIELYCSFARCGKALRVGDFIVSVKGKRVRRLYCQSCWNGMFA